MEKKRKLLEADTVNTSNTKVKKKKNDLKPKVNAHELENQGMSQKIDEIESNKLEIKEKKRKKDINENDSNELSNKDSFTDLSSQNGDDKNDKLKIKKKRNKDQNEIDSNEPSSKDSFTDTSAQSGNDNDIEENDKLRSKKKKKLGHQSVSSGEISDRIDTVENCDEISNIEPTDGDGINTPTSKKPPRKSGETKKQYKRRMKALREAGLLIDPPVVEGVKKDKRNRKTRKEKRVAKQQKNEELEKFRSIVQINYLKTWKTDLSKWKFNKNVQGKIIKHMFDSSRIPQDIFEILIEYVMGTQQSTKMHEDINKKCSQIVEAMEKWSSADETEKKKLTEPDQEVYERARQLLQSLA